MCSKVTRHSYCLVAKAVGCRQRAAQSSLWSYTGGDRRHIVVGTRSLKSGVILRMHRVEWPYPLVWHLDKYDAT